MKFTTVLGALLVLSANHALAGDPAPTPAPSLVQEVTNRENERLLADSNGNTLYVFDLDKGKPAPACNGDCAEVWPPYLLSVDEAKTLVAPLGLIQRANRKAQLTYEGRPVYNYAFDRVRGDDKGDGVGGLWHYIELK